MLKTLNVYQKAREIINQEHNYFSRRMKNISTFIIPFNTKKVT